MESLESSSSESFAWTRASSDTSSDDENMAKSRTNENQSDGESEYDNVYKKKLLKECLNGNSNEIDSPRTVGKRKITFEQSDSDTNEVTAPKKKIKMEPESDNDTKKIKRKHNESAVNRDMSDDESYLNKKVKEEHAFTVPEAKTKRTHKGRKSSMCTLEEQIKFGEGICDKTHIGNTDDNQNSICEDETYIKNANSALEVFEENQNKKKKKKKKSKKRRNSTDTSDREMSIDDKFSAEETVVETCDKTHIGNTDDNQNSICEDETYIKNANSALEVFEENQNKKKKKKKKSKKRRNSTDTSDREMSIDDKFSAEETVVETCDKTHIGNTDDNQNSICEDETYIKNANSALEVFEENQNKKKKKKKKSKKRRNSTDTSDREMSIDDKFSAEETVVETPIQINNNTLSSSLEQSKDEISMIDKVNANLDDAVGDTIICTNNRDFTKNHRNISIGEEMNTIIDSSINISGRSNQRTPKISDRILFEEDDSEMETNGNETFGIQSSNLKKILKTNSDLKPIVDQLYIEAVISQNDEIWVMNCPQDLQVGLLQDKMLTLEGKCKIKVDGQTYEAHTEVEEDRLAVMSMKHNSLMITTLPVSGTIHLRKRVPKPHFQEDNIKLPAEVVDKLKIAENETSNNNRKKKKTKKKEKALKLADEESYVEPKLEVAPNTEPEREVALSTKKKKKKRKLADEDEIPLGPNYKKAIKLPAEVVDKLKIAENETSNNNRKKKKTKKKEKALKLADEESYVEPKLEVAPNTEPEREVALSTKKKKKKRKLADEDEIPLGPNYKKAIKLPAEVVDKLKIAENETSNNNRKKKKTKKKEKALKLADEESYVEPKLEVAPNTEPEREVALSTKKKKKKRKLADEDEIPLGPNYKKAIKLPAEVVDKLKIAENETSNNNRKKKKTKKKEKALKLADEESYVEPKLEVAPNTEPEREVALSTKKKKKKRKLADEDEIPLGPNYKKAIKLPAEVVDKLKIAENETSNNNRKKKKTKKKEKALKLADEESYVEPKLEVAPNTEPEREVALSTKKKKKKRKLADEDEIPLGPNYKKAIKLPAEVVDKLKIAENETSNNNRKKKKTKKKEKALKLADEESYVEPKLEVAPNTEPEREVALSTKKKKKKRKLADEDEIPLGPNYKKAIKLPAEVVDKLKIAENETSNNNRKKKKTKKKEKALKLADEESYVEPKLEVAPNTEPEREVALSTKKKKKKRKLADEDEIPLGPNYKKAIKLPAEVVDKLKIAENETSNNNRKKKKTKKKEKALKLADEESYVEPKLEVAPNTEPEREVALSTKKKKKKRKLADEDEIPLGPNYKKAIKLPAEVVDKLKIAENETSNNNRKKKKTKKKEKALKLADEESYVEPKLEVAPNTEPEREVALSTKKKKKKRKLADEDEIPLPKKARYTKHELPSVGAWDSEKAIEENLFNF